MRLPPGPARMSVRTQKGDRTEPSAEAMIAIPARRVSAA